jgi:hypothetical protein
VKISPVIVVYYDITRPRGYLTKKKEKRKDVLAIVLNKTVNCRVPIHMHEKENVT